MPQEPTGHEHDEEWKLLQPLLCDMPRSIERTSMRERLETSAAATPLGTLLLWDLANMRMVAHARHRRPCRRLPHRIFVHAKRSEPVGAAVPDRVWTFWHFSPIIFVAMMLICDSCFAGHSSCPWFCTSLATSPDLVRERV